MTRKEAERLNHQVNTLQSLGFSYDEAEQLRRISTRLHRWYERECGDGNGCIERDDVTDKPVWRNAMSGRAWPIRDLERAAERRLKAIMDAHKPLGYFLQTDPRGAALYIIRPGDVPEGQDVHSYYNRGICVY